MIDEQTIERFWKKVEANEETGCWLWAGAKQSAGYGHLTVGGKQVLAHRFAWEAERGPMPGGLELDHLCRVRHCVNPDHLEPVDHRTNALRGVGVGAVNAAKTECVHGHPYDETNTYWLNGWRRCRTCRRLRNGERRLRQKAVVT